MLHSTHDGGFGEIRTWFLSRSSSNTLNSWLKLMWYRSPGDGLYPHCWLSGYCRVSALWFSVESKIRTSEPTKPISQNINKRENMIIRSKRKSHSKVNHSIYLYSHESYNRKKKFFGVLKLKRRVCFILSKYKRKILAEIWKERDFFLCVCEIWKKVIC